MSVETMVVIGGCLLAVVAIHWTLEWWDRFGVSRKAKRMGCNCEECQRDNEGYDS